MPELSPIVGVRTELNRNANKAIDFNFQAMLWLVVLFVVSFTFSACA